MGGDARLRWVFETRFARLSQARFGSPLRSCVPSFRDCPWRSASSQTPRLAREPTCWLTRLFALPSVANIHRFQ